MLMNHVCLPLPPCPRGSMERGGGIPPGSVMGRGRPPPLPSLRGGGSSQPQPDPLEDKSPLSPNQLRLKISSCHHVDDWGVEGEDCVPSPAPSPPQAKRRGNGAWTARGHLIFRKNPPGAALLPKSTSDRRTAPARPRSRPLRALSAGYSRIHWGLICPYDAHTELDEHVSRPRDQASRHNSVANSVWQRAEACNRSRTREPDAPSVSYPCLHHRSEVIDRLQSWTPQQRASIIQPLPSDPHHRATQPPRHTEPCVAVHPGPSSPQPPIRNSATASARSSATRRSH